MSGRDRALHTIEEQGIIAVVRAASPEKALVLAEAIAAGGIRVIEITMTVPDALGVVRELIRRQQDGATSRFSLVGAGTVMDEESARAAIEAGASFVVSPHFDPNIVAVCNSLETVCVPGTMTVSEIAAANRSGADAIKLFPGGILGPGFVRAVREPMPGIKVIPTGGVDLDNIKDWFGAGCIAVGVGSGLTSAAKTGGTELVTVTAARFLQRVREARGMEPA